MTLANTSIMRDLQTAVGAEYINNLPMMAAQQDSSLIDAIYRLQPNHYTLHIWNDALQYLINETPKDTVEEAYTALLAHFDACETSK